MRAVQSDAGESLTLLVEPADILVQYRWIAPACKLRACIESGLEKFDKRRDDRASVSGVELLNGSERKRG